jgi:uncharacterized SAM-binding protein YcdF (DUF218 family)
VTQTRRPITDDEHQDAELIWDYHQMHYELEPCDVGICLGGPDPNLPIFAAELYHRRLFPVLLFTGANSPDTLPFYPDGEAVGCRETAVKLGVPDAAILVEPEATNTGQNMTFSRQVLAEHGLHPESVLLISMPYMQRRAYATCRKVWPEVDIVCASEPIEFDQYAKTIGEPPVALDMILGDMQRVMEYPKKGFAIEQDVPDEVEAAFQRLVVAGYTSRLARL